MDTPCRPRTFLVLPAAVALLALLASALPAMAAEDNESGKGGFDTFQKNFSGFVLNTADRVDRFFGTDRYYTYEENRTRLKLLFDVDTIAGHGTDATPRIRLHLVLPRFQNRLRIIFNDEPDDGVGSIREDIDEDADLALRWIGRQSDALNLSFDVGLRYRDENLAGFGRVNSQLEYELGPVWDGRSTTSVYWYTDTGWRLDLRQYFERDLSDHLFLRSLSRAQWFEEENGIYPEQIFGLYQRLRGKQAIVYEAIARVVPDGDTFFEEDDIIEPDDQYTHFLLRARYRRNVWRPWLFFELWPTLTWTEERDYETDYGGRLRLEIYFGYVPGSSTYLKE